MKTAYLDDIYIWKCINGILEPEQYPKCISSYFHVQDFEDLMYYQHYPEHEDLVISRCGECNTITASQFISEDTEKVKLFELSPLDAVYFGYFKTSTVTELNYPTYKSHEKWHEYLEDCENVEYYKGQMRWKWSQEEDIALLQAWLDILDNKHVYEEIEVHGVHGRGWHSWDDCDLRLRELCNWNIRRDNVRAILNKLRGNDNGN